MVLDTKWKNIEEQNPASEDLRQMFVYSKYFNTAKTTLVYPDDKFQFKEGHHFEEENNNKDLNRLCGTMTLKTERNVTTWQKIIADT